MMNYNVSLNTEEEKDIFANCQQLEMLINGKATRGAWYPYTLKQAEKVATDGEALGCWV